MKYLWAKASLHSGKGRAFGEKRDTVFGILKTSLRGLLRYGLLGPAIFRVSDLVGHGWRWRTCIFNKLLDAAHATDLGPHFNSHGWRAHSG